MLVNVMLKPMFLVVAMFDSISKEHINGFNGAGEFNGGINVPGNCNV